MNSKVIIHLSKLDKNLEAIQKRLNPGVMKMAVIKDNAYGHGIIPIAKHLEPQVEWFCVARAEEGKTLREAGINLPILVFEIPQNETISYYTDYELTATLGDLSSFKKMHSGTEYHINIDTGMHRLGIQPEEVNELKQLIAEHQELKCTGIYTHYFKADDPGNPEVQQQLELFNSVRTQFPPEWMTHTANTGGIFHYAHLDLQFDAVRPGVCLYGYGAGEAEIEDLHPILDWNSSLMQVKPINKGAPVSYGGRWTAPNDGFIGIVPTGYSHGIPRVLSSNIHVKIGDNLYPQVGTISMDYSVVYLGDDKLEIGETVSFLTGDDLTAKDWARKANTIPYEITTNIKDHIPKEYRD